MNLFLKYSHWAAVLLGAAYALAAAFPRPDRTGGIDFEAVGKLPIKEAGRVKPLETYARTMLLGITERETATDKDKQSISAIQWYLDVVSSPPREGVGAKHLVFRIANDQVLNFLELKAKPGFYRYSFAEIEPNIDKFLAEYERVQNMPPKKMELFHEKILELGKRLGIYLNLGQGKMPEAIPPQTANQEWHSVAYLDRELLAPVAEDIRGYAAQEVLKKLGKPAEKLTDAEVKLAKAQIAQLAQSFQYEFLSRWRPEKYPAAAAYDRMLQLYALGNANQFNDAVRDFRETYLNKDFLGPSTEKVNLEWYFDQVSPFYVAGILYVFVLILACSGWLAYTRELQRAAFCLAIVALVVHTLGLIGRIYLQGRPPVTNLYASSVFIGWGGVVLCLGLERIYRNGIGNALAAVAGAATMVIAKNLAESLALDEQSDTLALLAAVLDTNFWLSTHVTSVTLGYTATFIAGLIGVIYIVGGIFTTTLDDIASKTIGKMMYGVVCFAMFLSFVGTVLGGIWADQSWGRFWGWDPKENGAVLIVIWNALILHARWSGLVKLRGMAMLTVGGVMVTTWSWFGTNQLGIGLHAYGFDHTLAIGCRTTWLICLGIIALAALPTKYWRSFSEQGRPRTATSPVES